MVPPLTPDNHPDTSQPLTKWQKVGTFGSQIDCTSSMQNQQSGVLAVAGPITQADNYNQIQAVEILQGRCVSAAELPQ